MGGLWARGGQHIFVRAICPIWGNGLGQRLPQTGAGSGAGSAPGRGKVWGRVCNRLEKGLGQGLLKAGAEPAPDRSRARCRTCTQMEQDAAFPGSRLLLQSPYEALGDVWKAVGGIMTRIIPRIMFVHNLVHNARA